MQKKKTLILQKLDPGKILHCFSYLQPTIKELSFEYIFSVHSSLVAMVLLWQPNILVLQ